ncbi:chromobox protein homolog 8 isoform X1 [Chrysemys picta bellii]|uniref:Chromobox 8 n=1 Tax=Chrysemys picta bellii TaxID=8478 RepID=A0A8C3FVI2_CHRPI|nr:chromobox protein homolog 8 isoform X1 [Chrysemys picta bellii]
MQPSKYPEDGGYYLFCIVIERKARSCFFLILYILSPPHSQLTLFLNLCACPDRYSTWEPEENILDARLLAAFEEREREMELYGPKKRGPKPKTFLLKAQAKAKAKTYEFRSDSARGIRVPYPGRSPQELGSTSRAREGLRNIALPAQGSPSTLRGESIRDRVGRMEEKPGEIPKKRGPKPRKEHYKDLPEALDVSKRKLCEPGDKIGDYLKTRKIEEAVPGVAKFGSGHSVIQLARRQEPDLSGAMSNPNRAEAGMKLGASETYPPRVTKHRSDFLDPKGQDGLDPGGPKIMHSSANQGSVGSLYRDSVGTQSGRPSLIARIPVSRILGDPEEESWSPSLNNLEKVVVTDVTSNFLTVTIKESSTDQGFFKEKR